MLRKVLIAGSVCVGLLFPMLCCPTSIADGAKTTGIVKQVSPYGVSAEVTLTESQPPGGASPQVCFDGTNEIACWKGDYGWNPELGRYCKVSVPSDDDPLWDKHRDSSGKPTGHFLFCLPRGGDGHETAWWRPGYPYTFNIRAGIDPVEVIRSAIATLTLHPPTVGVGAYVLKDLPEMGRATYIGAPLWLWVNRYDSLQWGTHTLSASVDQFTVSATVKSAKVTYDTGDGSTVTCLGAGDARTSELDRLRNESPSGCQHRYMVRSEMDNPNDRFTISATVTWRVQWSTTDGQYGSFTFEIDSIDNPSIYVAELFAYPVAPPS